LHSKYISIKEALKLICHFKRIFEENETNCIVLIKCEKYFITFKIATVKWPFVFVEVNNSWQTIVYFNDALLEKDRMHLVWNWTNDVKVSVENPSILKNLKKWRKVTTNEKSFVSIPWAYFQVTIFILVNNSDEQAGVLKLLSKGNLSYLFTHTPSLLFSLLSLSLSFYSFLFLFS